jgi:hypothetical protein
MENKNYGIDAEAELMKLLGEEMNKTKEEKYSEIKEILNIESFMNATNNNLDMLFKYMFSTTKGIRLSNIQVGEFIKDEYGDDFFYRRETIKCEEYQRENKF